MKPSLLVLIPLDDDSRARIAASFDASFDILHAPTREARADTIAARGAAIRAVLTNGTTGLTAGEIDQMPMLEFVSALGAGYENLAAEGTMAKNDAGKEVVTRVVLKPAVAFAGTKAPSDEALQHLHHLAHDACFLANSVKTVIDVEGSWSFGESA